MQSFEETVIEVLMQVPENYFLERKNKLFYKAIDEMIFIDMEIGTYRLDRKGSEPFNKKTKKHLHQLDSCYIFPTKKETIEKFPILYNEKMKFQIELLRGAREEALAKYNKNNP